MSILPFIQTHEASGDLRRVLPPPGISARRGVFLGPKAQNAIDDATSPLNLLSGRASLQAMLERWVAGREMPVRLCGTKPGAFLALLEPPSDEVWEFRITEPVNHFRAFCRFAMPNLLIVTHVCSRRMLGEKRSAGWKEALATCTAEWDALFPGIVPHHGRLVNDYITENFREIGAQRTR